MPRPRKTNLRKLTLDTAERAVNGSRQAVYAGPEQNFERIRLLWNTHLINRGIISEGALSQSDVALMIALVKVARLTHSPNHLDSWVDLAGYAACGAEVSEAS